MGLCVGIDRRPLAAPPVIIDPCHTVPYPPGEGPWYVVEPSAVAKPRVASAGPAGLAECPAITLVELLRRAAKKQGPQPALKVERLDGSTPALVDGRAPPALPEEEWLTWTWEQYVEDVQCFAKACIKYGFKQYDSLNIWGFNSPEWMIAAYAASFAGGKVAGLYPTDTDETAAYKVSHSGGSIIVIEDRGKLEKLKMGMLARSSGDAKRVKAIVAYGFQPKPGEKVDLKGAGEVSVYGWNDFMKEGKGEPDDEMEKRISSTQAGNCAALIYTSGTTGDPKAVMISHDNIHFEAYVVMDSVKKAVGFGADAIQERYLSYLPLSHVAGMMIDIVAPVILTSDTNSQSWCTGYFARPYDLKVGTIKDRLQAARPTIFLGVPLVWEKIADKIRAIGAANSGLKKSLGDWAKEVNLDYTRSAQLGAQSPDGSYFPGIARTIMGAVKANLGLQECKFAFTGAAPIRVDTLEYFGSLDLPIYEVYGMSECTGAATFSLPSTHQWGSCGFALPGTEVKIFRCDETDFNKKESVVPSPGMDCTDERHQGEVCFRGRHIMMGYLANEDALGKEHMLEIKKKTAETIDNDGWLHSGDKGMLTQQGMLKITGRYKELIIGEGGENIAPIPIEDHVKKMCDGIAEIMMVGDKRKYNVALVTLKAVGANGEVPGTDDLDAGAARINPDVKTISAACKDEAWIKAITDAIKSANDNGKVCANNAAKIQKFTILPTNFSEQNGELTPTKKLKRKQVETIYKEVIEKLYTSKDVYVPFLG